MTDSPPNPETQDVPAQVFERFIEDLRGAKLSEEIVARLQKVLLEDHAFNENALKAALFGEEFQ